MLDNVIEILKILNIKAQVSIEVDGWDKVIVIKSLDFMQVQGPMTCRSLESFESTLKKLKLEQESDNVFSISKNNPSMGKEDNSAEVIPFTGEYKIKYSAEEMAKNPYADYGIRCQPSDPDAMEKAVCFVNNIFLPRSEQSGQYKNYLDDRD